MLLGMAISTTEWPTGSDGGGSNSLLDALKHQQMLLFIVCGLGGALVLLVVIFVVCKCKQDPPVSRPASRNRRRVRPKDPGTADRTGQPPGRLDGRTRKRSRDMRNVIETTTGDVVDPAGDFRATNNGFLSP